MRNNIVHIGAGELTYEIRAIVEIADKLRTLGIKTNMENIGDPIAKGEIIPQWMKKIVADLAMKDCTYGYCATKGVLETRELLAEMTNRRGKAQLTPDDVIFFNGLGDASRKFTACCAVNPASSGHHRPTPRTPPVKPPMPDRNRSVIGLTRLTAGSQTLTTCACRSNTTRPFPAS